LAVLALPMVLPAVVPMFTGTFVVAATLIPVNVDAPTPVRLMFCTVFPCTECAGVVAVVVLILIPVNGTVVPLKVKPDIILLLMIDPPVVVAFNQIALIALVLGVVILLATEVLPIVLPVVPPMFTRLADVAAIPVKVLAAPVPARVMACIVLP